MQLPLSNTLPIHRLGRIFQNTTATYKYFWFLSILQIHAQTDNQKISVWDLLIRMVANAWYPVHYFRLSFGKMDSLYNIVMELQAMTQIPIDADVETITETLQSQLADAKVKSTLRILGNNVPYRFLRPWINTSDDKEMLLRSQTLENDCLYSLYKEKDQLFILLNPKWNNYLHHHYNILTDFTYWNLTLFLQVRNPNVPAIPNKLIRPYTRTSLTKQHHFWNEVIHIGGPVQCIYTHNELHADQFQLDHFIPWSFVSHDLNWNLIPADSSINSSKSNKLPDLQIYLPKLAALQHHALQTYLTANKKSPVLEDYLSMGCTASELINMNNEAFLNVFQRTFTPISQIAQNMGFEKWEYSL